MGGQVSRWAGDAEGGDRGRRLQGFGKGAVRKRAPQEGGEVRGRVCWGIITSRGLSPLLCSPAINVLVAFLPA